MIRSTGGTGTLSQICSSVSSEGGTQKTGITTAVDTNGTLISCAEGAIQIFWPCALHRLTPDDAAGNREDLRHEHGGNPDFVPLGAPVQPDHRWNTELGVRDQ